MNAQADLNLCWANMFKGTIPDVAAQICVYPGKATIMEHNSLNVPDKG